MNLGSTITNKSNHPKLAMLNYTYPAISAYDLFSQRFVGCDPFDHIGSTILVLFSMRAFIFQLIWHLSTTTFMFPFESVLQ